MVNSRHRSGWLLNFRESHHCFLLLGFPVGRHDYCLPRSLSVYRYNAIDTIDAYCPGRGMVWLSYISTLLPQRSIPVVFAALMSFADIEGWHTCHICNKMYSIIVVRSPRAVCEPSRNKEKFFPTGRCLLSAPHDRSNPDVFDDVNVYGDIKSSDIHHMYYGMYSYGHQGGIWTNNLMHDNHQYGETLFSVRIRERDKYSSTVNGQIEGA